MSLTAPSSLASSFSGGPAYPSTAGVERVGGLQTQYAPSGHIGLWSRVEGFERDDLTRALERRRVVQGTVMRETIHMASALDYHTARDVPASRYPAPAPPPRLGGPMTYCLALRLDEGLVFLADTRTNAGVDNVSTYRKLHVLRPAPDRLFVLESAGNLATTQEVLDRIHRDLTAPGEDGNLATVGHLFEAALYVGRLSRGVADRHREALSTVGADGTATFILGGQIAGAPADIFLVYPEGNYIRASEDRPFLQIGESKYGKSLLDLAVSADVDLASATKIALGSMMSTARANLSVGPPYDAGIYRNDSLAVEEFRVAADSPLLAALHEVWERLTLEALAAMPGVGAGFLAEPDRPDSA